MTDLSNDPRDDAFAHQLRRLTPATASTEESSPDTLTVERLLYQAGYQAALEHSDDVDQRQMRLGEKSFGPSRLLNWMPIIAASVMTAVLTLPLAYRMGRRSPDTTADTIAQRNDSTATLSKQPDTEEPGRRSSDQPATVDPQDVPESTVRPIPILNLARILQPEWTLPERSTETLTAFNARSLDSIPRSGWIVMEDESNSPQETMSAGDLGKFTIGLQVNQR